MHGRVVWRRTAALAALVFIPTAPAAAFQARMNKPQVQEAIAPGQARTGSMEVENLSDEPVLLEVYLQDWEYVEGGSGDKLFSAPGTSARSASGWINFFPQRLELPGRGRGVVEYTIRVPEDAVGGSYSVMFFESLLANSPKDENGATVQYTGRMGALFEIEAAETQARTGEIASFTLSPFDDERPLALTYAFRNTGNVILRPKAFFNLVDAAGRYFGRGEFPQLYTHPGRSGEARIEWTGSLAPGEYTVILTVDLGNQQVLVAEQPLRAPGTAARTP